MGGEAVRVALWLAAGGRGLTFGGETGEGFFLVALWVAEGGRGLTFGVWMGVWVLCSERECGYYVVRGSVGTM